MRRLLLADATSRVFACEVARNKIISARRHYFADMLVFNLITSSRENLFGKNPFHCLADVNQGAARKSGPGVFHCSLFDNKYHAKLNFNKIHTIQHVANFTWPERNILSQPAVISWQCSNCI
jgi:hypothetical protein